MNTLYPEIDNSTHESTDTEPRVCFDINCTFPYGDICQRCNFDIEIKKIKRPSTSSRTRVSVWLEEVLEETKDHLTMTPDDQADPVSVYGTDEERNELIDMKAVKHDDRSLAYELDKADGYSGQQEKCPNGHVEGPPIPSPQSQYGFSGRFEEWLAEVCDHTFHNQLEDDIFNDEEDSCYRDAPCPLCSAPQGNTSDQHLLQCIYAHEEQIRLRDSQERQILNNKNIKAG